MLQARTLTPAQPAAPGVPAAPQAPGANVVTPQMLTRRDVEALRARGDELSRQIRSATERRESTRRALTSASGADKAGLEQRLGVLDARIARIETDIAENGEALASIPARLAVAEQSRSSGGGTNNRNGDRFMDNLVPMVVVFTLFVLTPIAVSISRLFWKRGSMPARAVQSPENAQRLERMEQAIDTIAIEMERVSEGQRFITRILSEGRTGAALGEGGQRQADAVGVPRNEPGVLPRY
jgi:cell division septum initiation protein DivIVA